MAVGRWARRDGEFEFSVGMVFWLGGGGERGGRRGGGDEEFSPFVLGSRVGLERGGCGDVGFGIFLGCLYGLKGVKGKRVEEFVCDNEGGFGVVCCGFRSGRG